MLNHKKMSFYKKIGVGVICIFLLGLGFGNFGKPKSNNSQNKVTQSKKVKEDKLDQKQVTNFLMAYFTKKDLGENRNRYKEYMTDPLYSATVSTEEQPVNQTYKGYVVDQVFENAEVYIDNKDNKVIAIVSYKNTLLKKKNNYKDAQKDVPSKATMKLTYQKIKGKYLVNNISSLIVTDSDNVDDNPNSYSMERNSKEEDEE